MKRHLTKLRAIRAFSMIEILVVVGIMSLLMVMGAPTMTALFSSSKIGQGSQHLVNFLTIARQTAIKENAGVEVRFYKFENKSTPQKDDLYQAYRMFLLKPPAGSQSNTDMEVAAVGLEPLQKMPGNCYITDAAGMSSMLNDQVILGEEENVRGLESNKRVNAPYRGFVFRPDGSVNLPQSQKWFLTVLSKEMFFKKKEGSPDNYVCLSLNPVNGDIRQYTP